MQHSANKSMEIKKKKKNEWGEHVPKMNAGPFLKISKDRSPEGIISIGG